MSTKKTLNYWKKNFTAAGISADVIETYLNYIEGLLSKNVPIIFDFNHLCLLTGKNKRYLSSVINSSQSHYRSFQLRKRKSNKTREIRAPYPALKGTQSWVYKNILSNAAIHSSAHGFTNNKSIITNAGIHAGQEQFLKIDLKDFFPSIGINKVISVFRELGYTKRVSFYLAAICCVDEALPQGAPTSPVLSNIIARTLDNRLMSLAEKFNLRYTRYADDLAFSGPEISVGFIKYVYTIIEECGFTVNEEKTVLSRKKGRRILTGLSIVDSELRIPRNYKRKLKQETYIIKKHGLASFIRRNKIKNPDYVLSLIGKIRFWLTVEPNNKYAKETLGYLLENYASH